MEDKEDEKEDEKEEDDDEKDAAIDDLFSTDATLGIETAGKEGEAEGEKRDNGEKT